MNQPLYVTQNSFHSYWKQVTDKHLFGRFIYHFKQFYVILGVDRKKPAFNIYFIDFYAWRNYKTLYIHKAENESLIFWTWRFNNSTKIEFPLLHALLVELDPKDKEMRRVEAAIVKSR